MLVSQSKVPTCKLGSQFSKKSYSVVLMVAVVHCTLTSGASSVIASNYNGFGCTDTLARLQAEEGLTWTNTVARKGFKDETAVSTLPIVVVLSSLLEHLPCELPSPAGVR